jgi:hypothetical protein
MRLVCLAEDPEGGGVGAGANLALDAVAPEGERGSCPVVSGGRPASPVVAEGARFAVDAWEAAGDDDNLSGSGQKPTSPKSLPRC